MTGRRCLVGASSDARYSVLVAWLVRSAWLRVQCAKDLDQIMKFYIATIVAVQL